MTVGDALAAATGYLDGKGVESARLDAELLLASALARTRLELYLEHDLPLTEAELSSYRRLVQRRGRREPLAYVLGEWGFRRLTLRVDRRALIPRPETEIVVERCLARLAALAEPRVLDVGTGSGAIALAIADEHPGAQVTGMDSSADALALAAENAAASGLTGVRLEQRDVRMGLGGELFDLVVSNPPYVAPEEFERLQPEIRDWEPRSALVAPGSTSAVARAAVEALKPAGWLVLEVGDGRAASAASELEALGYEEVTISPDLAGRERVVEGRR